MCSYFISVSEKCKKVYSSNTKRVKGGGGGGCWGDSGGGTQTKHTNTPEFNSKSNTKRPELAYFSFCEMFLRPLKCLFIHSVCRFFLLLNTNFERWMAMSGKREVNRQKENGCLTDKTVVQQYILQNIQTFRRSKKLSSPSSSSSSYSSSLLNTMVIVFFTSFRCWTIFCLC